MLGCLISSLFAATTVAMPFLKTKFLGEVNDRYSVIGAGPKEPERGNKIKLFLFFTAYSFLHIVNMMLVMTMNGWVDLFMLGAVMITYFFLYS